MELRTMQENEVLEQILGFVGARNKKQTANNLIKRFGSLKQVFDTDTEELNKLISEKEALLINFIKECAPLYTYLKIKEAPRLHSPTMVVDYLKAQLSGQQVEKLYMLLLNSANRLIESIELESGTVNKSVIIPRKIASIALKYNAPSVMLSHNHPGGTLKPSQNDIDATNALKETLSTIDTTLVDHIIISQNDYFSFKEYGLL